MRPKRPLRVRHRGLRVVGPGFYLWEPDAREALRMAAELGRRPEIAPLGAQRGTPRPDPIR